MRQRRENTSARPTTRDSTQVSPGLLVLPLYRAFKPAARGKLVVLCYDEAPEQAKTGSLLAAAYYRLPLLRVLCRKTSSKPPLIIRSADQREKFIGTAVDQREKDKSTERTATFEEKKETQKNHKPAAFVARCAPFINRPANKEMRWIEKTQGTGVQNPVIYDRIWPMGSPSFARGAQKTSNPADKTHTK